MSASVGWAQSSVWERVGSTPTQPNEPAAWGIDGRLWVSGRNGVEVLLPPYDSSTVWQTRSGNTYFGIAGLLVVGPDTLVAAVGNQLYRSTDDGVTFVLTRNGGIEQPVAIPYGLPHGGRIVVQSMPNVGQDRFAVVSRDRGATWTEGVMTGHPEEYPIGNDATVVLTGPRAGRVVVAGTWGLAVSDDGGDTWAAVPGWWAVYRYQATAVSVVRGAGPGGGDRLVAGINDTQSQFLRVIVSDDGGDTWRETAGLGGDPNLFASAFVDLGGGADVWESTNGGETWPQRPGVVPGSLMDDGPGSAQLGRTSWALLGPDGRLYVGGIALGRNLASLQEGWMLRTAEPFVVSAEGAPSPTASGLSLSAAPNPSSGVVTLALSSREPERVRVVVVDVTGREVWAGEAWATPEGASVVVDASGWATGVYVAHVAGGESVSARFTVAR